MSLGVEGVERVGELGVVVVVEVRCGCMMKVGGGGG